jgi:hypothetical protein
LSRLRFRRKLNQWNTGDYDTRSAQVLSEGNGLSSFTLKGSKQLGSKFLERAKTLSFTRAE